MGIATPGSVNMMLTAGEFDLAQAVLDLVTVPTMTSAGLQLDGMLALSRSLVAAADKPNLGQQSCSSFRSPESRPSDCTPGSVPSALLPRRTSGPASSNQRKITVQRRLRWSAGLARGSP